MCEIKRKFHRNMAEFFLKVFMPMASREPSNSGWGATTASTTRTMCRVLSSIISPSPAEDTELWHTGEALAAVGIMHGLWEAFTLLLARSGDHDMTVPFLGTQAWIRSLNFSIVDDWRSWFVDGQVAGWASTVTEIFSFSHIILLTRLLSSQIHEDLLQ